MSKYIKSFNNYVFEQDMGMPVDPLAQPASPKPEKPMLFLFIDDADTSKAIKKYPDGSKSVDLPVYSVTSKDLNNWVDKNIISTDTNKLTEPVLKLRRDNLKNIVDGNKVNISNDDHPFIEKLKNAVATNIFGKREADTTVVFTSDNIPTCDKIDITFIKYKKQ